VPGGLFTKGCEEFRIPINLEDGQRFSQLTGGGWNILKRYYTTCI
jgi:hypothetical protein